MSHKIIPQLIAKTDLGLSMEIVEDKWEDALEVAKSMRDQMQSHEILIIVDYNLFDSLQDYINALNEAEKFRHPDDFQLVEEAGYWRKYGVSTAYDLARTFAYESYSNVYKSAYGIRPRKDMSDWTPEQIRAETQQIAETSDLLAS